ncbi:MAG: class I SAM-dependent methyltransferase [Planctomycetes bacterium]|nr:class I SAM-dependent methyltransferase [Planctomycetota bacterium]
MNWLRKIVTEGDTSIMRKVRRKRFKLFVDLLDTVPKPVNVLDLGGTQEFWESMGFVETPGIHITLLNLVCPDVRYNNFKGMAGDATDLSQFGNDTYDIVFSNSVIEHVGPFERQLQMANEIKRVGQRYLLQTPNYYFPIEPHFFFPGFQWLPVSLRIRLLMTTSLGWHKRMSDQSKARQLVENTRLLKKAEIKTLFPDACIVTEKLFDFSYSFIVYGG